MLSSEYEIIIGIITLLAVPQEVDSYHGLCPIEVLETPTDQVRVHVVNLHGEVETSPH